VAVVGAGPVGLTVAWALARAGVDVTVLEADGDIHRDWRASTFHPPTLELLEGLGVVEEMLARGLVAPTVQYRDRSEGLIAQFDCAALAAETRYPFRLQLEQYKYADILFRQLTGAKVRFNHRVVGLEQDDEGVRITVRTPGGVDVVSARYLVGADGANSTVRQLLGLDFSGWTYDQRFLLISTDLPFDEMLPGISRVNYIADPQEFVMLLRIPDIWRVLVPVPPDRSDEEVVRPAALRRVLERIAPEADPSRLNVFRHQLYRVHQRVAERLRVGRVLLAGDAGHVNSPMGGFGLNSGIHDALDLAPRLVRLLGGAYGWAVAHGIDAEAGELDTYDENRRRVALDHVRAMSHRNTSWLTESDPELRAKGIAEMRRMAADPGAVRKWLRDSSMITSVREQEIGGVPRSLTGPAG